jgi:hypothetical protein
VKIESTITLGRVNELSPDIFGDFMIKEQTICKICFPFCTIFKNLAYNNLTEERVISFCLVDVSEVKCRFRVLRSC